MSERIVQLSRQLARGVGRAMSALPTLLIVLAIGPLPPLACIVHCAVMPQLVATHTHHHHWAPGGVPPAHLHGQSPGELPPPPPARYEFVLALVALMGMAHLARGWRPSWRTGGAPQLAPTPPTPPPRPA
jgi:hypothetical protein